MQVKTILNRLQKHPGFVYTRDRLVEATGGMTVEVEIRARSKSRPVCSGCGRRCAGYDTLAPRRFEFVPLWGLKVLFVYARRRADSRRSSGLILAARAFPPFAPPSFPSATAAGFFIASGSGRAGKQTTVGHYPVERGLAHYRVL